MNIKLSELGDALFESVKVYIARNFESVAARIEALEKRAPESGPMGPQGQKGDPGERGIDGMPGKDGAPGERGEKGEKGDKGDPGERGEKGDPGMPGERGPAGERGADGRDGIDGKDGAPGIAGKDGAPGRDGIDGKDADPAIIRAEVERAVAAIPLPQDGKDAPPVDVEKIALDVLSRIHPPRDGRDGAPGKPGEKGDPGQDGRDGKDGLSIEDFDIALKDGRTLEISLKCGDRVVTKSTRLDIPLDRGTFKPGNAYQKGDGVTYGGSWWIAQADTAESPGTESKAWRLAVKRGRDGKDGAANER